MIKLFMKAVSTSAIIMVVCFIVAWALVEIFNDATYIKEEPQTFIIPKDEMLILKAGYLMGNEAGKNGYNVDSAWSVDSAFFYNKFFKPKTKKS